MSDAVRCTCLPLHLSLPLRLYFAALPAQLPWQGAALARREPTTLARSARWGALRSEIKAEAEGWGTFAEQSASLV